MSEELITQYCGGCGHLYFNSPKVTIEEAKETAKTLRCHYCIEDEKEDKKRGRSSHRPSQEEIEGFYDPYEWDRREYGDDYY